MNFSELLLIAIGLSMDAFAVSIGKGLSVRHLKPRHTLSVGIWFGGFQALMPLLGYAVASSFAGIVASFDHWIAFALLAFIGAKMIHEACSEGCDEEQNRLGDFTTRTMLVLAVATSIDALAVGVSFAFLGMDIWISSLVIGLTTFLFSMVGIRIGHHFGARYRSKAAIVGGAILILIGIKILVEQTLGA